MAARTIAIMGRSVDQEDGIGIYTINLLREMFTLDPDTRYLMLLQTERSRDLYRDFPNVETHVLPARSKFAWDQWYSWRAAVRLGADLIFNPKFSIPLLSTTPSVFVHQGCDWYVNPANYPWWDNVYIRLMLPLYNWRAAKTLSISQAILEDLAKYAHMDVQDAIVTYAGVAPNFHPVVNQAELDTFRRDYSLPKRFILSVARACHGGHPGLPPYPGGNVERLIRAYQCYRANGGTLALVIVGSHIREYLHARGFSAAELGGVVFLGWVPNVRMHLAYQLAECFILTTLCESFSFPLLEAMSTGCPAIVPSTCASPEVAGGAAYLIDPRDEMGIAQAMHKVVGSETLRAELRAKGLARARDFSWRRTAERTLATLHEIIATSTSASPDTDRSYDGRRRFKARADAAGQT